MKQFVPLRDEDLYAAAAATLQIVPYQVGLSCHHALEVAAPAALDQRWNSTVSPTLTPSLSAVPPLSSSTYLAGALLG